MEQRATTMSGPPISGVLSRLEAEFIVNADDQRKYVSSIDTVMTILGRPERSSKSILYNIGARSINSAEILGNNLNVDWRLAQTVRMSDTAAEQLQGMVRKYSNFTGNFSYMDLSAMGYQLAKAVACYSITGRLSVDDIRGGKILSVRSLNVRDAPVNSSDACVFIPRVVDENGRGGTFAALTAAANSHGAMVFTDIVTVDGNNAPIVVAPVDGRLALACVHGLRILLSMYDSNSNGPTMAFAITKGFHEAMTVVGHTDEGAWFRSALRRNGFIAPFGGVYPELASAYIGLPIPTENQPSTFIVLTDTICLTTAAAVAVSDPCVTIDGRRYPTVSTSEVAAAVAAGNVQAGGPPDVDDHLNRILQTFGDFSINYVRAISSLFSVDGDGALAASFLTQGAASLMGVGERHLEYKVVAPYFWIEPTTLFKKRQGSVADVAGFGVIVGSEESTVLPSFEEVRVIDTNALAYNVAVMVRSPRTSGLLLHLNGNVRDGLAFIVPRQFMTDRVLNKGGVNTADAARAANLGMQDYVWGRGHSAVMAPAENLYLGGAIGMTIVQARYVDLNVRSNHVPTAAEITNSVTITCHHPSAVEMGALQAVNQRIRRCRSLAGDALNNAIDNMARSAWTGGEPFATANAEPSIRRPEEPVIRPVGVRDVERFEAPPPRELEHVGARQPIVMQMREARAVVAHGQAPMIHNAQLAAEAADPGAHPPEVGQVAGGGDAAAAEP